MMKLFMLTAPKEGHNTFMSFGKYELSTGNPKFLRRSSMHKLIWRARRYYRDKYAVDRAAMHTLLVNKEGKIHSFKNSQGWLFAMELYGVLPKVSNVSIFTDNDITSGEYNQLFSSGDGSVRTARRNLNRYIRSITNILIDLRRTNTVESNAAAERMSGNFLNVLHQMQALVSFDVPNTISLIQMSVLEFMLMSPECEKLIEQLI